MYSGRCKWKVQFVSVLFIRTSSYMNHSEAQDEATAQKKILDHVSFFVIFQSNLHDTVAVHLYQKMLIRFLTKIEDQTENHLFSRWMCSIIYE